jgi:hypothetical protein
VVNVAKTGDSVRWAYASAAWVPGSGDCCIPTGVLLGASDTAGDFGA